MTAHSARIKRSGPRHHVHTGALVKCAAEPGRSEHPALVRDVSPNSVFFYSDFVPSVGSDLTLVLTLRGPHEHQRFFCKGRVIRVEQVRAGAATGIAARIDTGSISHLGVVELNQASA